MSQDHDDYARFLVESGLSECFVRAVVDDMRDHIDIPCECFGPVEVAPSPVQGVGVFATGDIPAGTLVGPARVDGRRTFLGRRMNHSADPNCVFRAHRGDLLVLATRGVLRGEELSLDYRQALRENMAGSQA